jgi:hypothetical protein
MDFEVLVAAVIAALVLEKLFEAVFGPLWEKLGWDPFFKLYAALVLGSVIAWATGLNAFPVFSVYPLVGRILTCLAIGAGTSFIYDLIDRGKKVGG